MMENTRTNIKILVAAFIPMVIMSIIRYFGSDEELISANRTRLIVVSCVFIFSTACYFISHKFLWFTNIFCFVVFHFGLVGAYYVEYIEIENGTCPREA